MQSCFFVGQDPDYQLYAPTVLDEVLLNRKKTPEIMWKRPVLILDEPTSGLEGKHMREMAELLRSIADSGACVLIITHDTELISHCADFVYKMYRP